MKSIPKEASDINLISKEASKINLQMICAEASKINLLIWYLKRLQTSIWSSRINLQFDNLMCCADLSSIRNTCQEDDTKEFFKLNLPQIDLIHDWNRNIEYRKYDEILVETMSTWAMKADNSLKGRWKAIVVAVESVIRRRYLPLSEDNNKQRFTDRR